MTKERLQKILAHAGYGSRRACEDIIRQGRVMVDGHTAHLGDSADPDAQHIAVDGQAVRLSHKYLYVALHKPRGVISSVSDPQGRRTVRDLVPLPGRLYPVGRLDANSEGLILMTNDGGLTQHLTHPRYGHKRVYRVLVEGEPDAETLEHWQQGVTLDGKRARFSAVSVQATRRDRTWLRVTVREGRNHLVRRMVAALGHPARRLVRTQMGPIHLGDLPLREWRYLNRAEIKTLERELNMDLHPTTKPATRSKRRRRGSRSRRRR
jgi:pseudouridine synthase